MTTPAQAPRGPASAEGPTPPVLTMAVIVGFSAILCGEMMDMLDTLVTTIAGPSILRDLGGDGTLLQWLAAGYTLALASGVLIGGRLGDRFGRRRLFSIGMSGFIVTSLISALAITPDVLLAARVGQGALGALMLPQGMGLIRDIFPVERLGTAFGVFGLTMALSAVAGPIVAGSLVDANLFGWGWRTIFAINIPLGLAGLIAGRRSLPTPPVRTRLDIDVLGALLAIGSMFLLVLPLVEGRELGWPAWCVGSLIASGLGVAAFVVQQRARTARGKDPIVVSSLFAKRAFVGGAMINLLFFGAFMSSGFVLAIVYQLGRGLSPLHSALATCPQAIGMLVGFSQGSRFATGGKLLLAGFGVAALGQAILIGTLASMNPVTPVWWLAPGLFVAGAGSGVAMGPMMDVVMGSLHEHETGSAAGILNAIQQVAGAVGIAGLGTLLFTMIERDPVTGFTHGAAWAYGLSLALTLLAAALTAVTLPPNTDKADQT